MISFCVAGKTGHFSSGETHSNCCEDVLQFVDERNELRVVDVDPAYSISLGRSLLKAWDAHE